jgi:hypothetical protein
MKKIILLLTFLCFFIVAVKAEEYPWLNLLNIIFTPVMIVLLLIFGVSAVTEKMLNSGGIGFLVISTILLFIFSVLVKVLPFWLPVIFIIVIIGYIILRGRA